MKHSTYTILGWGNRRRYSILWITGLLMALIAFSAPFARGADIGLDTYSGSYNNGWTADVLSWPHDIGSGENRMLVVGVTVKDYNAGFRPVSSIHFAGVELTRATSRHGLYHPNLSDFG